MKGPKKKKKRKEKTNNTIYRGISDDDHNQGLLVIFNSLERKWIVKFKNMHFFNAVIYFNMHIVAVNCKSQIHTENNFKV